MTLEQQKILKALNRVRYIARHRDLAFVRRLNAYAPDKELSEKDIEQLYQQLHRHRWEILDVHFAYCKEETCKLKAVAMTPTFISIAPLPEDKESR